MSTVQPSRRVAFDVIHAVSVSDAYANLLLPIRTAEAKLNPADAGFATELAYGTLRRRGTWDRIIELAAKRSVTKIDPLVLDVLRLGVHQLLGMRVAPHAAVDEAVTLTRKSGASSAAGFVNGVLRTVTRSDPDEWMSRALDGLSGDARLSIEFSHPAWIIGAFRDALDAEGRGSELEELLAADNVAPAVSLVALPGLADVADSGEPGSVSPLAIRSEGGDPALNKAVAAGRLRVQDEGSQLAALALSRARPVIAGERWLDLCAGPGGKAALLGAEAAQHGASVVANEVIPARAGLVRRAIAAIDPAPEVIETDGREIGDTHPRAFDRILLDAPCTGLGALRRRPEARWRKSPADVAQLTVLQGELLDGAAAALRPGGIIAYVTCSPHLPETRETIEAALERHPELTTIETPAVLQRIATRELGLADARSAQLWPHRNGTDAMFVQLLGRVEK